MNCKPGDLAVMVRSSAGNEGRIVRCIRLDPAYRHRMRDGSVATRPCWYVGERVSGWEGGQTEFIPDEYLRPLRDPGEDAQDESLAWLPSPGKVTEAA